MAIDVMRKLNLILYYYYHIHHSAVLPFLKKEVLWFLFLVKKRIFLSFITEKIVWCHAKIIAAGIIQATILWAVVCFKVISSETAPWVAYLTEVKVRRNYWVIKFSLMNIKGI